MARKKTPSDDIVEIEHEISQLISDLETRVGRLNTMTRKSAANAVNGASDYVSETLAGAAERLREAANGAVDRAHNGASAATDEASRLGGDALQWLEEEVGQRPLFTLAIAAGIGFIAGMAGRRH